MAGVRKYRILSVEPEASGIRVFKLEATEGAMAPFLPGQFVFLHILDKGKSMVKRPYSITSLPSSPYLEFIIKMVGGEMTGKLEKMKAGEVLGVEGPFGAFTYTGQKRAAFIGGGCGISPFIGILRHIADKKIDGSFMLFYSAKTREEIIYEEEFERLQKTNPGIKVVVTLTRESPQGWEGERGRVNDVMIKKYISNPGEFDWWMCGPKDMVVGLRTSLIGMGVEAQKIRIEGWG